MLDEYCKQLTNADTAQNKCTDSNVSDIQLPENMINESIPISVKEECFEDDQYYFESTITIEKHEVSPADIEFVKVEPLELQQEADLNVGDALNDKTKMSEYDHDQTENDQIAGIEFIKVESLELKQETCFNVGDVSTSNDDIIVLQYDHKQTENVKIGPIVGTSGEINISSCSNIPNDAKAHAESCNTISSNSLSKHKSIKSKKPLKKRSFKCDICNKIFSHSGHLKEHEKVHSRERPFSCKICKKSFIQSGHLKAHERVHSGERPYKCNKCNKTFTRSGILRKHEVVHSGVRAFNCKICNKKFTQAGHLKEHDRVHSGERPYKCKICNKKFTHSRSLKRHEADHRDRS